VDFALRNFGPSLVPLLQVGWRGIVQTDAGFRAHLNTIQNHKDTCTPASWETLTFYAKKLRAGKVKVAFFSSTPQGGGVALMRHALVRFSRLMGVDLTWYGRSISPIPAQVGRFAAMLTCDLHSSQATSRCIPNHQERAQYPSGCQPPRPADLGRGEEGHAGLDHRQCKSLLVLGGRSSSPS